MRTGATYIGTGWIRTSAMSNRFRPALPIELQCHIPPSKTVCSGLGQAFRGPVLTQPETVNVSVSKADQAIHSINRSFSPIASCLRVRDRRLVPHERCGLSAILSWYDLRRIFPQGGRRTTLQGGFRKEVGRKNVAFGHYSPIQYTIRIYAVSTIYYMYIMLYYTIYCYHPRMGGGKLQLLYLRAAGHIQRTWPMHRGLFLLFSPRPFFFMNWLR